MELRKEEPKKKRFRIVKLEERVVPSHFPAVAQVVVGPSAVENAPTHAHKVDFTVLARNTRGCGTTHVGV